MLASAFDDKVVPVTVTLSIIGSIFGLIKLWREGYFSKVESDTKAKAGDFAIMAGINERLLAENLRVNTALADLQRKFETIMTRLTKLENYVQHELKKELPYDQENL